MDVSRPNPGTAASPAVASSAAASAPDAKAIEAMDTAAALAALGTGADGLDPAEADARLDRFGPNALAESHVPLWRRLIAYFWAPIPWMIEAAAILSAINGDWESFGVIVAMLLINGGIGFWQEKSAADALDALKGQLALKARVRRGGAWRDVDAARLVPGDIVRVRLGDVVPADLKLLDGDYLSIDQSALTGESLPVARKQGELAWSSTVVKEGEMTGLVFATGSATFFGRTAKLVQSAGAVSHFQKAVLHIGNILIIAAVALSALLTGVELMRGLPLLTLLSFVLIVVVASIPVALPAVLSVTMALGALALSRMKAIVSRLEAIEEMAGVTVLCSDKTGTLTENRLTLGTPIPMGGAAPEDLVLAAALACKQEDHDAIDTAVLAGLKDADALATYRPLAFVPFDPVHKRTEATVGEGERRFRVTKGAPQVVMALATLSADETAAAMRAVEDAASRGFRTLGVARSDDDGKSWRFLGILPLFDPPRADSRDTIAAARAHGIDVKMVTGDNAAIAREIAGQLGLGTNIRPAGEVLAAGTAQDQARLAQSVEAADGFAEVFPEHKYAIVRALQQEGHIVAMTGDGVNDAPALKQAEVGIAVSGATDAARSAASLILTAPGLSVIISAVEEARRIFERMMSYTIYRIAMTLSIMVFVVMTMLIWNLYPLTTIMIILLALLDDIPIMTIAWDNAELPSRPVRWDMNRLLAISSVLGALALAQSFGLYLIARDLLRETLPVIQTMMFLRFIVGGHLLLFSTRTRHPFWRRPYPSWPLLGAIVATQIVGVLFVGFGWLMTPIGWSAIGLIWLYDIAWFIAMDLAKLATYHLIEGRGRHQRAFLGLLRRRLHPVGHNRPGR